MIDHISLLVSHLQKYPMDIICDEIDDRKHHNNYKVEFWGERKDFLAFNAYSFGTHKLIKRGILQVNRYGFTYVGLDVVRAYQFSQPIEGL